MSVKKAAHRCACGCGGWPKNWSAAYIKGHRPLTPLADRLWRKVEKTPGGCWVWQGYRHPERGYGQIGRGRTGEGLIETHRAAWEVTHGPIPEGMFVCHSCDNPPCCNPADLFLGTPADNVADMLRKGREARGIALPQARLTDAQVEEIHRLRGLGWLQREIADRFGVTQGYVSELLAGHYRRSAA